MNKIYKLLRLLLFTALIVITSCNEDFLDRVPLDSLSEETFFKSATDLQNYTNGLYGNHMRRYHYQWGWRGQLNLFLDANSDIVISSGNITGSLNQLSNSGVAPVSSSTWNRAYDRIRSENYFLVNYNKVKSRDINSNQYIGEGYFFRALDYFGLLTSFGDVPIIKEPLNIDSEELYRPRDSRYDVAKFIIADLDSAIMLMSWKGQGPAKSGRVNKQAAMVLKARVALFEGTWERYHSRRGTKFAVQGKDGSEFLNIVVSTIDDLIEYQGNNIFRNGGLFNEPYNQLFSQNDASKSAGVFWYRVYDASLLSASHNFYWKIIDSGASITRRLVKMYIDSDGYPQSISSKPFNTLDEMGQNLEPRFRQTVWTPDRGPIYDIEGRQQEGNEHLRYPLIAPVLSSSYTSTGFRNWKGAIFDASEFRAGNTDDILIRYAEGLLAYAEAKAVLGTITQEDIDKTVNVLRDRVGTPPMNLSVVNGWNISYNEAEGFDVTESNIVNEIRRERTVELALDGYRLLDIKRWAVFDKCINGYKPQGAKLQEFINYFNDPDTLVADGYSGNSLTLDPGTNCGAHANGNINPYFRHPQFQDGGEGYYIDKDRDYLSPIPTDQIDLYNEKGVTLTQNPGWN